MPVDPTGYAGPHPDLRPLFRTALENLRAQMTAHPGPDPSAADALADVQPADLTVRAQRTWHDIQVPDPDMRGSDLSAGIVQFVAGSRHYSFFIESQRQPGASDWKHAGINGGEAPQRALDRTGGFMITGGQYVCVGRLRPRSGRLAALLRRLLRRGQFGQIEIEHADGATYRATVLEDGGCIVFAPVRKPLGPADEVTVRYLDEHDRLITQDRTWIGDGGPPPASLFAAMRS